MRRRTSRSTRTNTLFPYTPPFRAPASSHDVVSETPLLASEHLIEQGFLGGEVVVDGALRASTGSGHAVEAHRREAFTSELLSGRGDDGCDGLLRPALLRLAHAAREMLSTTLWSSAAARRWAKAFSYRGSLSRARSASPFEIG